MNGPADCAPWRGRAGVAHFVLWFAFSLPVVGCLSVGWSDARAAEPSPSGTAVYTGEVYSHSGGYYPGGILIRGGAADSSVTVRVDASGAYVVTDRAGIVALDPFAPNSETGCTEISPTAVRCENKGPSVSGSLGYGNDRLKTGPTLGGSTRIFAGSGDDRLEIARGGGSRANFYGGAGDDVLIGGAWAGDKERAGIDEILDGAQGHDQLIGRNGPDRLRGGRGRDLFSGGQLTDVIHASHNDRDRSIRCGPGRDVLFKDGGLDPDPRGCDP